MVVDILPEAPVDDQEMIDRVETGGRRKRNTSPFCKAPSEALGDNPKEKRWQPRACMAQGSYMGLSGKRS